MIENTPPSRILHSNQDRSVNFVWDLPDNGALEARYVRRDDDYFIVYLSSQSGCNQACRFCHLTATKQVSFDQATLDDYLVQAREVLKYYDSEVFHGKQVTAKKVHFNWMARGEPLLNPVVTTNSKELFEMLAHEGRKRNLDVKFNISSIVPMGATEDMLRSILLDDRARIYYSLYSLDTNFRKRWLPKAQCPYSVLDTLAKLQRETNTELVLHWAFIENENDSEATVESIAHEVSIRGIKAKFNLVRYNPYSEKQGKESNEQVMLARFDTLKSTLDAGKTRIVPRVGFDVKASCGMFVHPAESE